MLIIQKKREPIPFYPAAPSLGGSIQGAQFPIFTVTGRKRTEQQKQETANMYSEQGISRTALLGSVGIDNQEMRTAHAGPAGGCEDLSAPVLE